MDMEQQQLCAGNSSECLVDIFWADVKCLIYKRQYCPLTLAKQGQHIQTHEERNNSMALTILHSCKRVIGLSCSGHQGRTTARQSFVDQDNDRNRHNHNNDNIATHQSTRNTNNKTKQLL